jgi:beta-lactamase class D
LPLLAPGAGPDPAPVALRPVLGPPPGIAKLLLAACLALFPAGAPGTRAAGGAPASVEGLPWVVVDYSARGGSYRIVGDVSLLSQRYSPGTTFDLIVAAVGLHAGALTEGTEISCRTAADPARTVPLTLARALREPNEDFFSQVLKRTGYEPIREFLQASRYTPGIPEAVASFGDLARGEPLRVTVFEQNLFLQAFLRRELPVAAAHLGLLERSLSLEGGKTWGVSGIGEVSSEPPRHLSWFNAVARRKDGDHVITVAALTSKQDSSGRDRFLRYLAAPHP